MSHRALPTTNTTPHTFAARGIVGDKGDNGKTISGSASRKKKAAIDKAVPGASTKQKHLLYEALWSVREGVVRDTPSVTGGGILPCSFYVAYMQKDRKKQQDLQRLKMLKTRMNKGKPAFLLVFDMVDPKGFEPSASAMRTN